MATNTGFVPHIDPVTGTYVRRPPPQADSTDSGGLLGGLLGGSWGADPTDYSGSKLIDPNWAESDPAGAQGALTQAQWADYMERFAPLEGDLMRLVSGQHTGEEIQQAGEYAQMGTQAAQGALQRDTERRGIQVTPEQALAVANRSKLQGALDLVGAKNSASRAIADRNFQSMGTLVGMGKGVASTAQQSLSGAASMANSRDAADKAASAQQKQQNMSMVGTAAGLGAATWSSWGPALLAAVGV